VRVAIIGARGFMGSAICAAVSSSSHTLVPVGRETYEQARRAGPYDVVINAAMPSKRFWARQNPALDFAETVEKTFGLVQDWTWTKFVQISSVSARSQLDTVYGRHKAAAERLCLFGPNLIVRLGPMYGRGLTKGPLVDLAMDRTVFAAGDSRYCFTPVDWAAQAIVAGLDLEGIVEIGANDSITLHQVARAIGSASDFRGPADHQEVLDEWPGAPSSVAVVDYARALRGRLQETSA
jgi:nucleoside-diphosphate-sugar epimerase